jgi:hypothetical protein
VPAVAPRPCCSCCTLLRRGNAPLLIPLVLFLLLALVLFLILVPPTLAQGSIAFERTYGGTGWEEAYCVQETRDGGIILAGATSSFGAGTQDVYVVKTDAFGDTLWTHTYGTSFSDIARCIRQTADDGYIVAGNTSGGATGLDFFLVRTDAGGNEIWRNTFDAGLDETAYCVEPVSDGGFILVGKTQLSFPGLESGDMFVVKTNAAGDSAWSSVMGGDGVEEARAVEETPDGGFLVAGTTGSWGAGSLDFYLVRTDSLGGVLWARTYGGPLAESAYGMCPTFDGGHVLAGSRRNGSDSFFHLVRLDASADTLWTRTDAGDSTDVAYAVSPTRDGGFVATGSTSNGPGGLDFCQLRTNAHGDRLWRRTYGGANWDVAFDGAQTQDGGYVLGGYSRSFDSGNYQFYLVKIMQDSTVDVQERRQPYPFVTLTGVPNPFRRVATVSFALPTTGPVRISVYDIRGRRVAQAFAGTLAEGSHHVSWDASSLPSGVYHVRLDAQQGRGSTKLLLLR